MTKYLKNIDRQTLALKAGMLQAIQTNSKQIVSFEIPKITIYHELKPTATPILIRDITAEEREAKAKDTAKTRYLKSLASECLSLPLAVLGDDKGSDSDITLDAIFIDLDTDTTITLDKDDNRIDNVRAMQLKKDNEETKTRPLKVREAVADYKKCVILGDPGAGKSTFVRELCARLAGANLGKNDYPQGLTPGLLPIFIQLRNLAPKIADLGNLKKLAGDKRKTALLKIFQKELAAALKSLEAESFGDDLRAALTEGNCLLVLDGLDEVPFAQRDGIRETVSALVSRYQPARMIITCRVRSYTEESELPGFRPFTIASLDEEKVNGFIAAWYGAKHKLNKIEADKVKKRIPNLQKAAAGLMELASNPMMLTTMAIIHFNKHELPDERVKLYKLAVDILLHRWRRERLGDDLPVSEELAKVLADEKKLHKIAARLGYEAQASGKRGEESADIDRDRAIIVLYREGYLPELNLAEEFLDYVDQQSGLLMGKGGKTDEVVSYGFFHRSFQEYLAGCHIVSKRNLAAEIRKLSKEGEYWSLTLRFGFEELYHNQHWQGEPALKELAWQLCLKGSPTTIAASRQALWASHIALLLRPEAIAQDGEFPPEGKKNSGKRYLQMLRGALVKTLGSKLPFPERAEAGRNLAALGELESLKIKPLYNFRSEGIELSEVKAKETLKAQSFFDSDWHKSGGGCIHIYEEKMIGKDNIVIDHASGLMWEQSGSDKWMVYKEAEAYIARLNREKFAGFSNWRLPTFEEGMGLMEREKKGTGLYLDPVFDVEQRYIWTADRVSASSAWVVGFGYGDCLHDGFGYVFYVRAVRSSGA